uniref:Ig-like domain-containing protein n=1 Tax=Macrostomum lignano TaxID=282301 RepID=A0A1I8FNB0_9PLAT
RHQSQAVPIQSYQSSRHQSPVTQSTVTNPVASPIQPSITLSRHGGTTRKVRAPCPTAPGRPSSRAVPAAPRRRAQLEISPDRRRLARARSASTGVTRRCPEVAGSFTPTSRPDAGAEESTSSAALVRSRAAGSRVRPCRRAPLDAACAPRTAPLAQRRSTGCGQRRLRTSDSECSRWARARCTLPRCTASDSAATFAGAMGQRVREIYTRRSWQFLSPPRRFLDSRRRRRSAAKRRSDGLRWRGGHAFACATRRAWRRLQAACHSLRTPSIDWGEGRPAAVGSRSRRSFANSARSFGFAGLVAGDSGLYQCLAGSPAGSAQRPHAAHCGWLPAPP